MYAALLNSPQGAVHELAVGRRVLREGDRAMQMANDYAKDVFNGDGVAYWRSIRRTSGYP